MSLDAVIAAERHYHNSLTSYVEALRRRSNKEKLAELAEFRQLPLEAIEEAGIFYIGGMAEMILPSYIDKIQSFGVISNTNNKPIFNDRWVIPIKTQEGLVDNLVGYSPKADERYIYGTAEYYRRRETLYGLENLELAYKLGYAVLVEGITDAIRLRSLGIKNSFAMCGTHRSEFIMQQLNRCRYGIIRIPDRDEAGKLTEKHWKTNRYVTIHISLHYKDSDEMLKYQENREVFMDCLSVCIDYLKEREHKGIIYPEKEFTIII